MLNWRERVGKGVWMIHQGLEGEWIGVNPTGAEGDETLKGAPGGEEHPEDGGCGRDGEVWEWKIMKGWPGKRRRV